MQIARLTCSHRVPLSANLGTRFPMFRGNLAPPASMSLARPQVQQDQVEFQTGASCRFACGADGAAYIASTMAPSTPSI